MQHQGAELCVVHLGTSAILSGICVVYRHFWELHLFWVDLSILVLYGGKDGGNHYVTGFVAAASLSCKEWMV